MIDVESNYMCIRRNNYVKSYYKLILKDPSSISQVITEDLGQIDRGG